MVHCLVTGAAGFIGSHLAERLLSHGHRVTGVDAMVPYYPREQKERNLAGSLGHPSFTFLERDLRTAPLDPIFDGVDVVFHLAAMAGLVASWSHFDDYMTCNLLATARVLDAARRARVSRFVHASTSSVYGRDAVGSEDVPLKPISPYGVTKLAAEQLALAHHAALGVPAVVLRYFSVYGPRQRPDMGYNIFIRRILSGEPITVFGDGSQTRGNTFISDCIDGTMLASERGAPGRVYNIGGGEARSLNWVIATLEELTGRTPHVDHQPRRPGDQAHTRADISRARGELGYEPRVGLREGLAQQVAWQRGVIGSTPKAPGCSRQVVD